MYRVCDKIARCFLKLMTRGSSINAHQKLSTNTQISRLHTGPDSDETMRAALNLARLGT